MKKKAYQAKKKNNKTKKQKEIYMQIQKLLLFILFSFVRFYSSLLFLFMIVSALRLHLSLNRPLTLEQFFFKKLKSGACSCSSVIIWSKSYLIIFAI